MLGKNEARSLAGSVFCVSVRALTLLVVYKQQQTRLTALVQDYAGEPVPVPERYKQSGFY